MSSRRSRSRIWRLVTKRPSRPAKGESETSKLMRTVGSSTASAGRASTFAGSHSVSEMRSASMPVTATMSPAAASGTATRVQPREAEHLQDPAAAPLAVAIHDDDGGVAPDHAALDPADADGAHIARIGERADLHLEGPVPVDAGRGDIGDDGLEEHLHVAALVTVIRAAARIAPQGGGEHHPEVELFLARPQAIEEVEGLVHDPRRARAGPVDLVHDHDGLETAREGLLGHEARLWHGTVHGIDEQQHGIHHRQDPLHLAAEIGMSRGIDDIDPIVPPAERRILGEDGDPALALQLVRVHDALDASCALAERPGLLQQAVDERGLAVVDVGDDGDVAKSFRQVDASRHGRSGA